MHKCVHACSEYACGFGACVCDFVSVKNGTIKFQFGKFSMIQVKFSDYHSY